RRPGSGRSRLRGAGRAPRRGRAGRGRGRAPRGGREPAPPRPLPAARRRPAAALRRARATGPPARRSRARSAGALPRARAVRDPAAFADYARLIHGCDGAGICDRCESFPLRAHSGQLGHAASEALWTPSRDLRGVVVVGIVNPAYGAISAQLTRASVAAALVVGAIAIPLVAMGARRLAAPLRRVAEAAESLAAGRRPEPIPPGGPREVDSLASSFNRMASSLDRASREVHAANARLESTVQQRTAELRELNARLELELAERARFFRAISHDLGAPLRNIAGAVMHL